MGYHKSHTSTTESCLSGSDLSFSKISSIENGLNKKFSSEHRFGATAIYLFIVKIKNKTVLILTGSIINSSRLFFLGFLKVLLLARVPFCTLQYLCNNLH